MICRLLFCFLLAAAAVNGMSSARAEEKDYDAGNAAQEEFDDDVLDIFDMPEKGDPYYDQKIEIRNEDAFLNEILKDGREEMSVEMLNDALAEYKSRLAAGVKDSEAFNLYLSERSDVCTGCIREIVSREYKESPVTAADSDVCQTVLQSGKFADRQDKITFKNQSGAVYEFTTFYSGMENLPETEMKVRQESEPPQQAVVKPVYFPMWQPDRIGYFELNGKLYASNSDPDAKRFSIFEFVPEHLFFKDVCTISSDSVKLTTVFGEQEPVCQKVAKKEYKTYPSVNMKNLMKEAYALYHQQMCAVSARQEGKSDEEHQACVARQSGGDYLLAKNSRGGVTGNKIDYNNDQNSEYIVQALYDAPQCRYTYLRVYDPNIQQTRLITTGLPGGVYPEKSGGGEYAVPCSNGAQSLVSIDGVNYLLTSNAEGPERLDEIITDQDGNNSLDHYCSFAMQRIYR